MDFRKMGMIVACIGALILLYGGFDYLSHQPVKSVPNQGGMFGAMLGDINAMGENLLRSQIRDKAKNTMLVGLAISVVGAVIFVSVKQSPKQEQGS